MLCSQPRGVLERGDDRLDLQVVLQAVDALLPTDAAHLVPAEGDRRVEDVEAVHPDRAGPEGTCQGVGRVQIVGENTGGQSILACIRPLDDLVEVTVEKEQWSHCYLRVLVSILVTWMMFRIFMNYSLELED